MKSKQTGNTLLNSDELTKITDKDVKEGVNMSYADLDFVKASLETAIEETGYHLRSGEFAVKVVNGVVHVEPLEGCDCDGRH